MRWSVFGALLVVQLLLVMPHFIQSCASVTATSTAIYLLHHPLDIFLFWSPLFLTSYTDHVVHALVAIGVIIHWITNNSRCIVTVAINELCGWPQKDRLHSLKNMVLGRRYERYNYLWLIGVVLYDFWVIFR
jgi:hypothetical protein